MLSKFIKNLVYEESEPNPKQIPKEQVSVARQETPNHPTPDNGFISYKSQPLNCDIETEAVLGEYKGYLEKVNLEGYDFYEFYQSIIANDPDNSANYPLIFSVAKTFSPTIDKNHLVNTADFYLTEINKSHTNFDSECKAKLTSIDKATIDKKTNLINTLSQIDQQISDLQARKLVLNTELEHIGLKDVEEIKKINCYIDANNHIKEQMTDSINKVKQNLIKYIN